MRYHGENTVSAVVQLLMLTLYADHLDDPPPPGEIRVRLTRIGAPLAPWIEGIGRRLGPLIGNLDGDIRALPDRPALLAATGSTLARITDQVLAPQVLRAMCTLAWDGAGYHYTEGLMIARASIHWDLPSPLPNRRECPDSLPPFHGLTDVNAAAYRSGQDLPANARQRRPPR